MTDETFDMRRVTTHPGEVLRTEFMEPLGLSANRLGRALGVPHNRITSIVRGERGITADTALRLAKAFGTTPQFWLNLNMAYELSKAETEQAAKRRDEIKPLIAGRR